MVEVTQLQDDGFFIPTTREEAMRIIESLAKQILNNNINTGRAEFGKRTGEDVAYFTIGVKMEVMDNPRSHLPSHLDGYCDIRTTPEQMSKEGI